MPDTQTYGTHRRFVPLFHFFALPVLGLNVLARIYVLVRYFSRLAIWELIVALALAALAYTVRGMATTAQDRIIRLEERLRLERLLPADLRARIGELTASQLIGLRFCSDAELPDLTRAVLNAEVSGRNEIKQRIKSWRPDLLRV